jgi:hypothetical protein
MKYGLAVLLVSALLRPTVAATNSDVVLAWVPRAGLNIGQPAESECQIMDLVTIQIKDGEVQQTIHRDLTFQASKIYTLSQPERNILSQLVSKLDTGPKKLMPKLGSYCSAYLAVGGVRIEQWEFGRELSESRSNLAEFVVYLGNKAWSVQNLKGKKTTAN